MKIDEILMAAVCISVFTTIFVKSKTDDYLIMVFKDLADGNTGKKRWGLHLAFFSVLALVAVFGMHFLGIMDGLNLFWQGFIHLFAGFALGYGAEWLQGMVGWKKAIQGKVDTIESGKDAVVSWISYSVFAWIGITLIQIFFN